MNLNPYGPLCWSVPILVALVGCEPGRGDPPAADAEATADAGTDAVADAEADATFDATVDAEVPPPITVPRACGPLGPAALTFGVPSREVTTADLDCDGGDEVVTLAEVQPGPDGALTGTRVDVWHAESDGRLVQGASRVLEGTPTRVVAGDHDGDGATDLWVALSPRPYEDDLVLVPGACDGSLGAARTVLSPATPGTGPGLIIQLVVAAGDLDSDGRTDLLTAHRDDTGAVDELVALLPDADGSLRRVASPVTPVQVNTGVSGVGDFDGDGVTDVLLTFTRPMGQYALLVARGQGGGHFTLLPGSEVPMGIDVSIGDLDGDGRDDLAMADGHALAYFGQADGTFSEPVERDDFYVFSCKSGDLDADGLDDAIYGSDDGALLIPGRPDRTRVPEWLPDEPQVHLVRDLTGDGRADLVALEGCEPMAPELCLDFAQVIVPPCARPPEPVLAITGTEVEVCEAGAAFADTAYALAWVGRLARPLAGDFDGDGILDLVILDVRVGEVPTGGVWMRGLGQGKLDRARPIQLPGERGVVADWDGDGLDEVHVPRPWSIIHPATATVETPPLDFSASAVFAGEFDGEDGADLVLGSGRRAILVRHAYPDDHPTRELPGNTELVWAGDVDGDGISDLVASILSPIGFSTPRCSVFFHPFAPDAPSAGVPCGALEAHAGDLDDDGDMDGLAAHFGLTWVENTGSAFEPRPPLLPSEPVRGALLAPMGIETLDLVLGVRGGGVRVFAGFSESLRLASDARIDVAHTLAVDLDGDGHVELVGLSPTDAQPALHVLRRCR